MQFLLKHNKLFAALTIPQRRLINTRVSSSLASSINYFSTSKKCAFHTSSPLLNLNRPISQDSPDQTILREAARRFTDEIIKPVVMEMDKKHQILPTVIENLFSHGFMGVEIPPEYGGSGMSFTDCVIIIEEIARADPTVAAMVDIQNTLVNRLFLLYGSDKQKSDYLPLCAQNMIGSFCISEPNSGSDAFALQTRATKVDNGWVLNGTKQWISSAKEAGVYLIFATVDPLKGHRGITCFIVDKETKGLGIGEPYDKLGLRASSTCEVSLSDVFVPDEKVLGEIGEGYKIAINTLNEGRIGIAAQMLGLAEGAFDCTYPYLYERKQFGEYIGDFQAVKFQVAQMATDIETARLMVYNCAALKECGLPFTKEAAMAKFVTSKVAESVASQCINLFGGNGFTTEYPVEKFFRDSKIGSIYEGTNNIQLETIAKFLKRESTK